MIGRRRVRALALGFCVCVAAAGGPVFAQVGGSAGDRDAPLVAGQPGARVAAPIARTRIGDTPPDAKGVITAISAAEIMAALTDAGFPARWVNAPDGERVLVAQLDAATPFQIVLQDCVSANTHCVDFELYAGFDTPNRPTADQINRWNRDKTWAAFGYLTPEGAPALRAQYTLAGGISTEHLRILLKAWGASLKGFLSHIGFQPGATPTAPAKP